MNRHAGPSLPRSWFVLLLLPLLWVRAAMPAAEGDPARAAPAFEPVRIPKWVLGTTRMAFLGPDQVDLAAKAGVQVIHTNVVWPYYPLRRDGGGLGPEDAARLHKLVDESRRRGIRVCLGLPPFPPVALVKAHPEWRVHPDDKGTVLGVAPREDNLGTRVGCNLGPWGDYLIEVCAELVEDYGLAGFSFDGNYHPPLCYCPACKAAYRAEKGRDLPPKVDLDNLEYREYLVWRGEKLEDHYRRMQRRLKGVNPDTVLMSWTTNAGRYGHFLTSPRVMSTRTNQLFDLPMQEWWLDETNFGASVAPAFGVAYARAVTGDRPSGSEPYLMARGNPYGSDSFPTHERLTRTFLVLANGAVAPQSFGWADHLADTKEVFDAIAQRERWTTEARPQHWAALLVSEQTRQFYAYKDIAERYLPHLFGMFRAGMEEHLALDLVNDWDLTPESLARYRVLVLANAAALSEAQARAVREYVKNGGGLVATCDTSLFDELGRRRPDFALADLFGVSYRGRLGAPEKRAALDANFAVTVDESYWKARVGAGTVTWTEHPLFHDSRLEELTPRRSATFRGPQLLVSEPQNKEEVVMRLHPEGWTEAPIPGAVVRTYGKGRVVYLAAGLDAAMWSYAYPYQRRMLARMLEYAAGQPFPISVTAPMCVQATYFEQEDAAGKRSVVHLFNGINTAANHGLPASEVPLREETVPIGGIKVRFEGKAPRRFHLEPGHHALRAEKTGGASVVTLPPLERHLMLVAEY
jgi:hypothetical protein